MGQEECCNGGDHDVRQQKPSRPMAEEPRTSEVTARAGEARQERPDRDDKPEHPGIERKPELRLGPPEDDCREQARDKPAQADEKVLAALSRACRNRGLRHGGLRPAGSLALRGSAGRFPWYLPERPPLSNY